VNGTFTVVAKANPDMTLCIDPNSPVVLDGSASINAQTYSWSKITPTVNIANTVTTSVIPSVGTNSYVLLVTSSIAICFDTDMVVINVNPLPTADAGPTQTISLYTQANLGGSPTSVTGTSFTWTPPTGLNNPNSANPITSTTVNTEYTVFVLDPNTGCVNSSTVDIFIYPDIKIPNGFTPNSDGINDTWVIDNIQQFTECIVEVYNRWGELLFQSAPGYPKLWNGRYHDKDLPVGTYYYIINLNHVAYPKPYTGPITIFR
jgi:gliding motility-associated-like protein